MMFLARCRQQSEALCVLSSRVSRLQSSVAERIYGSVYRQDGDDDIHHGASSSSSRGRCSNGVNGGGSHGVLQTLQGGSPRQMSSFQLPGWGSDDRSTGRDDGDGVYYHERKLLMGVTREDMYSVVTNVDEYEYFVPWCQKSVVKKKNVDDGYMEAELEVGFQMFVERYVSKIQFDFPHQVRAQTGDSSLFSHLDSCWKLEPGPTKKSVWVDFEIDFAFKSALYRQVANVFLDEVVKKMMGAFEDRCREKFGTTMRHRQHERNV